MQRRKLAISFAFAAAAVIATSVSPAGGQPRSHELPHIVAAKGTEDFEANALIYSTFRFDPGIVRAHTGERLRLIDQDRSAEAPHSLTLVRRADLPESIGEVFGCEACNEALGQHFATDPPTLRIDVGDPGLDVPGDSLLIFPGQSRGATVSAEANTNLWFLCSFHPWMQGRIAVG
jgi:hypothetical protein